MSAWRVFRFDAIHGFRWMLGSGAFVEGDPIMATVATFPTAKTAETAAHEACDSDFLEVSEFLGWAFFGE